MGILQSPPKFPERPCTWCNEAFLKGYQEENLALKRVGVQLEIKRRDGEDIQKVSDFFQKNRYALPVETWNLSIQK